MRRYETFVITDPDISQEEREPVLDRVKELITQQDGFLVFEDVWGERKLAYQIKKKERGHYVRFDYCGLAPLVNEIERFFRIDDRALKYMTIVLDKDADLEKIKEEKAAAESQRAAELATQETPEETKRAELPPEEAEKVVVAEKNDIAEQEPQVEEAVKEPQVEEAVQEPQVEEAVQEPQVEEAIKEPQVEEAVQEPQVEEEVQASDTTESAEKPTPAEKKEEA